MKEIQISSLFIPSVITIRHELSYFLWVKSEGTYQIPSSLTWNGFFSVICFPLKHKFMHHIFHCHFVSAGFIFEPRGKIKNKLKI